jgi:hypothetical protein
VGELLLTLADDGRLVLDAAHADEVIARLERTLSAVRARLRVIRLWQQAPTRRVEELPDELARFVVDAVFADQLAPDRLELATVELPKYIEALRRARRLAPPGDGP